jgi:hypothetical protein
MDRSAGSGNQASAASETATVTAENTTVRPAERIVDRIASPSGWPERIVEDTLARTAVNVSGG